jgi:hypothetical protein
MIKELTSRLIDRIAWRLVFKTAAILLALFLARSFGFGFWGLFVFAGVVLAIYLSDMPERRLIRFSYWLLSLSALRGLYYLNLLGPEKVKNYDLAAFAVMAAMFFAVLGISHLLFHNPPLVYGMFNTALFFLIFLVYQSLPATAFSFLLLFLAVAILSTEVLEFLGFAAKRRAIILGGAIGCLTLEIYWLLGFLPLGFINIAIFMALFMLLVRNILYAFVRGSLDRRYVLTEATLFLILTIAVFLASKWAV